MFKYLPLILARLESGSVSGSGYFPTSDKPTTPRPTTPEATTEEPTTPEATTFGPTAEEPTTPSTFLYSFYACCNFFIISVSGSKSGSGFSPTSEVPTTPGPTKPEATTEEPTTREATTEIKKCYSMPCQNSGTCIEERYGYTCDCVAGFTGVHCETGTCLSFSCLYLLHPN